MKRSPSHVNLSLPITLLVSLVAFEVTSFAAGHLTVTDNEGAGGCNPAHVGVVRAPGHPDYIKIDTLLNFMDVYVSAEYGRVGWDDAGAPVDVRINTGTCTGSIRYSPPFTALIFLAADGDESVDVFAHEYYHGLLESEGIGYGSIRTKSLVESLCDIFAVTIDSVPEPADPMAWIIGETNSVTDSRDFTVPTDMGDWDPGNQYTNAKIHNHAAYLWATNHLGGDRDRMAAVYYQALNYLNHCSDFTMARMAAIMAAEDLGFTPAEIAGLEASYDAVGIFADPDVVYNGGNNYIVYVGGTLTENTTWCPDNVYVVESDLAVPFGLTLTIEAGTVVKFSLGTADLLIQGILDAQGTVGNPVVFTSFKDDSHGGDSNGNGTATSASPGNWGGLRFFNGNNVLEYCLLRYGGRNVGGMISVEGCSPRIANNTIEYSLGRGIYYRPDQTVATAPEILFNTILEGSTEGIYYTDPAGLAQATIANDNLTGTGGSEGIDIIGGTSSSILSCNSVTAYSTGIRCTASEARIQGNRLEGNINYGVFNATSTITVDARHNWWGDSTGPFHPTANPGGLGDTVSDFVLFMPWEAGGFTGVPSEYEFVLFENCVRVTDTISARDNVQFIALGTTQAEFAGIVYNLILGTNGPDNIVGSASDELILGFDGDDLIIGTAGSNGLIGGAGEDTLFSGTGNDIIDGNAGDDDIVLTDAANPGNYFEGGTGKDSLHLVSNGYGAFNMFALQEFEVFKGGDGDDHVDWSSAVVDVIMLGEAGNDTLISGSGNDIIFDGIGDDFLRSGGGDDAIVISDAGNPLNDMDGEGGTDRLILFNGYASFNMVGHHGFEFFKGGDGDDNVDWSDAMADVIMLGEVGNDVLIGGAGADLLTDGPGDDVLLCGPGDDTVLLADPANQLNVVDGEGGTDRLILFNGYGAFNMVGTSGFESFTGGDGDDNVDWSDAPGPVEMTGMAGNDTLSGGGFDDILFGSQGNDTLFGNAGSDLLLGEGGTNHLFPGDGDDNLITHTAGGSGFAHFAPGPLSPPCWILTPFALGTIVQDTCGAGGTDVVQPTSASIVTP